MEKKKGAKSTRNSMGLTVWLMMTEGWLTECTFKNYFNQLFQTTFQWPFAFQLPAIESVVFWYDIPYASINITIIRPPFVVRTLYFILIYFTCYASWHVLVPAELRTLCLSKENFIPPPLDYKLSFINLGEFSYAFTYLATSTHLFVGKSD